LAAGQRTEPSCRARSGSWSKSCKSSEGLDPDADSFEPDLAPVEFDGEAMAEALAEMRWDEADGTRSNFMPF
jgi:hypothetical protein